MRYQRTGQYWSRKVPLPFASCGRCYQYDLSNVIATSKTYHQERSVSGRDPGASTFPAASLSRATISASLCERSVQYRMGKAHLLLTRIANVLIGLEEGSDVDGLATPHVPVDGPVKCQFQRPPIERPADGQRLVIVGEEETHFTAGTDMMDFSLDLGCAIQTV